MELIRENKANKINIKRYYRRINFSYIAKDGMINPVKNEIYRNELIESICKN